LAGEALPRLESLANNSGARPAVGQEAEMKSRCNLERIQRDRVRGHQSDTPFSADVGDELEVIWNTYYSVADPILILRVEDLPERVDAYFQDLRTTGLLIRNLEATAEATQPWAEKRAAKIAAVVKLGQDARGLLEEVNRTW